MARGYIKRISTERDLKGFGKWIHVDFGSTKEGAGFWPSREEAEMDAGMLEHHDIAIITVDGQRHVCKGYQVEERAPGEFVVWVEAPFVSKTGTNQPTVLAGGVE